jgi:hypothetical protein
LSRTFGFGHWYGFGIFDKGFPDDDRKFVNKMFNRRHLIAHKGGRVDQEYLDNTGDTSVRLHEAIHVHSNEIRRLITLTNTAATNLIAGFDSIG